MDAFFTNIEVWLAGIGVWAYVVAPLVMAVVSVLPIPAEAPAMANGMLFGVVAGSAVTWVGALAGALLSYEIAHRWGRPVAHRFVSADMIGRVDRTAHQAGWWGLLVLRLIPVVAFTAVNWGAGLCDVPRWRFVWTTAVGILPGVILFTSSGVGLSALWTRSPVVAASLFAGIVIGSVFWSMRRRAPAIVAENGPSGSGAG